MASYNYLILKYLPDSSRVKVYDGGLNEGWTKKGLAVYAWK
ncbi:MAG: hypothetical protein ACPLZD_09035 [Candidatus Saccharicenans sp.]